MFSRKEIEENIESELSGNFRVKLVAKNGVWVPKNTFHAYVH